MNQRFTLFVVCLLISFMGISVSSQGQSGCTAPNLMGCSDFTNTGYYSDNPATLEYDNVVSAYHASAARNAADGSWQIWGERTKQNGTDSWLVPTTINPGNYSGLTGDVLKVGMGSTGSVTSYTMGHQFVLLTSNNDLWVWGVPGTVVTTSLTGSGNNSASFRKLAPGNAVNGSLPTGVTAANVRMMFVTANTIAITTCVNTDGSGGDVYVLSQNANVRNNTSNASNWVHIRKSSGNNDFLTGIIATRGTTNALIALDKDGNVWTWGSSTYLGNNTANSSRQWATQMTLPSHSGTIKMIGATNSYNNAGFLQPNNGNITSYYILYQDGAFFALGANNNRQLGDWSTTERQQWVQPRYSNGGTVMNDISYIAPQSSDWLLPYVSVLTQGKVLYNFGTESRNYLGRNTATSNGDVSAHYVDPGKPTQWQDPNNSSNIIGPDDPGGDEGIIFVASGGHTTVMLKECGNTFGYMGHRYAGSMGDNSNADVTDNVVHFNTNQLNSCGLTNNANGTLEASESGPYCTTSQITMIASIPGGLFSIAEGPATINANTGVVTFTGTPGTVRVLYTQEGATCNTPLQAVLEVTNCNTGSLRINGKVWDDGNGDAIIGGSEPGYSNGMWANLVGPGNLVMRSVVVNPADGTYSISEQNTNLVAAGSGSFKVILTNSSQSTGNALATGQIPGNDFHYTGTNHGTTGSESTASADKQGVIILGDLSSSVGTTEVVFGWTPNFGLNQKPTVIEKTYNVDRDAFSETPPTGFPSVSDGGTNFVSIPMNSSALTGYPSSSLTGHDFEDCPTPAVCETGTTFKINSIYPNTKLYYNDGGTISEIQAGDVITGFDFNNLVIYGAVGSGIAGDPVGFTYAMIDAAGTEGDPEKYEIISDRPLPVGLLSFNAVKNGNSVDLKWTTGTEDVNKGFSIERSADSENWNEIGFVNSKASGGNSNTDIDYNYTDNDPVSGNNYYRLKQISLDGRTSYSDVRVVKFSRELNISIYPNPARTDLNVSGLAGNETLRIYDASGRLAIENKANSNNTKVNVSSLSGGVYILRVISADGSVTTKKFEKRK